MKGAAILFGIIIIIAVVYFTGSWVTGEIDFKRVFGPVYTKENAPDIKLIKPNATDITIRAGKEDNKYYVGFQRESPLVQPPEGFTREELSSYYQKVELFGVRAPSTYSGGQFSIRAVSS
ncbi:MAG TPA: hypothetical protein VNK70_01750, partial [Candidatus Paceibacterota bacterium]|nr:hypothetical protein [Candidatus Paceibacterota bacterium]